MKIVIEDIDIDGMGIEEARREVINLQGEFPGLHASVDTDDYGYIYCVVVDQPNAIPRSLLERLEAIEWPLEYCQPERVELFITISKGRRFDVDIHLPLPWNEHIDVISMEDVEVLLEGHFIRCGHVVLSVNKPVYLLPKRIAIKSKRKGRIVEVQGDKADLWEMLLEVENGTFKLEI